MAQDFEGSGAQITNLNSGDVLKGQANTASSVDVWLSRVDAIST
jgi:hypothetical protein